MTQMTQTLRIGLIGAGYIARWHAEAIRALPGLHLTAVHDRDAAAADCLARSQGAVAVPSLEALAPLCDAVHVLTPPPTHETLAVAALDLGLHVLVEKPMALSAAGVERIAAAAHAAGRQAGVVHNFLGLPAHAGLRRLLDGGWLGRLFDLRVDWALPFAPLQSGPYGIWPLRETGHLLWEIAPHPLSFAVDLLGPVDVLHLETGQMREIPGLGPRPQAFRLLARSGPVEVTIALSFVQTHEERALTLRGSSGLARLDYGRDRLTVTGDNASGLVINPLRRGLSLAMQEAGQSLRLAGRESLSLHRRTPYGESFRGTLAGFYGALRAGRADPRFAPEAALAVARAIEAAVARLPAAPPPPRRPAPRATPAPRIAVIGGTGYIGRALVRELARQGEAVRVLSRSGGEIFADLPGVEILAPPPGDEEALVRALTGMEAVINLARSGEGEGAALRAAEVEATLRIGRAAARAGAGRLVHAGSIASYDMSDPRHVITEDTPFGPLERRNPYARAKAEGEAGLRALAAQTGLPLVIARPGIVVGGDGPLQHWGLGRWHGAGAVRLWNRGTNPLPFVLVDDVADGLIRMARKAEALGESFNLVGPPMLSARDWFEAIAARTGARIRVVPGSPLGFWAADALKALIKARLRGQAGARADSLADWRSRGHLSRFDSGHAQRRLGWRPESDREAFLRRAIDAAALFGA